jgi:hypothetical protein
MGALLIAVATLLTQLGNLSQRLFPVEVPVAALTPEPAPATVLSSEQVALSTYLAEKYQRPREFVDQVVVSAYSEAVKVGLSPLVLLAVIMKESSLNTTARSSYGAVGLMQVVPRWHLDKLQGHEDSPDEAFLAEYLKKRGGSLTKALGKYSGKADGYAERVLQFRRELEDVSSGANAGTV